MAKNKKNEKTQIYMYEKQSKCSVYILLIQRVVSKNKLLEIPFIEKITNYIYGFIYPLF